MPTSMPSSAGFDAPLFVEAGPSRAVMAACIGGYVLAGAGLAALSLPWASAGAAVLAVGAARDARRLARSVRLTWRADGSWSPGVPPGDARWRLAAATVITPGLVILELRDERGRAQRSLIARDALDAVSWRRLLARLRVRGPSDAVAAGGWIAGPEAKG